MPKESAYDLLVLLDADAPEERRAQIVQSVRSQIDGGAGTLKSDADWGVRKLAFEIGHRSEAQYHLFQLEAKAELLDQLRHMLAIEDGVMRHRILRLDKGAPEKAPVIAQAAPRPAEPAADEGEEAPGEERPAEQPAEQATEPAPEQPAEQTPTS